MAGVQLSAPLQQALRLQAFEQLVAGLAQQLSARPGAALAAWPAQGLPPAMHDLLEALLPQATAAMQPPVQLVAAQPGSAALLHALAAAAQPAGELPDSASLAAATAVKAAATEASAADQATPLPVLQHWLVRQGVLRSAQGERGFFLSLQLPVAWVQASASGLGSVPGQGPGQPAMVLPYGGDLQALSSATLALVLQARGAGVASRCSALAVLDLQPLPAPGVQAGAMAWAAPWMAMDHAAALALKGDPWLQMAVWEQARPPPVQPRHAPPESTLCQVEGCQYQGRAVCAQPFCVAMNRQWSIARQQRRR